MQEEIKKLSEFDNEALDRLYMRVFSTDDGRLVLEDLKQRCHYYIPTVSLQGDVDPYRAVYNEGMRSFLLMIETRLKPREEQ